MKQNLILVSVFIFSTIMVFPQDSEFPTKYEEGMIKYSLSGTSEIVYQNQFLYNFNLLFNIHNYTPIGLFFHGPIIGFENNFSTNNINGFRFGYSLDYFTFISLKIMTIFYNKSEIWDLRIMPEIGITLFMVLGITYGYSIPVFENTINEIGKHRITLSIKIPIFGYANKGWFLFFTS